MTPARTKVIEYARAYYFKHRSFPTIREICNATGMRSPSTVHAHLLRLESDKLILRNWGSRKWELAMLVIPPPWKHILIWLNIENWKTNGDLAGGARKGGA